MASCAKGAAQRQGRRAIPKPRWATARRPRPERVQLTIGDLVAAAFDELGDTRRVAKVLSSPDLACAIGAKIVLE